MLSKEDNELLTRVGPGTPMGDLLRQYWMPMLCSEELPEPDCPPIRTKLLGEKLVAFRDSEGRVGLLRENCPHRGASLFFGRNEDCGLRCPYHGWKFDVSGRCVDMPNEPEESNFKDKVRARAYPCVERRGVIWAYLGPRETPPPLPDLEWNVVPEAQSFTWKALRACNWVQALEGDIDTSHLFILHSRLNPDDDPAFGVYHPDKHPRLEIVPTSYGVMYGARRDEDEEHYYWRITQFMLPIHVFFPPNSASVPGHIWVPLDDEHTMAWTVLVNPNGPMTQMDRVRIGATGSGEYLPDTSEALGRSRLVANQQNDYLRDHELQRTRNFTGLKSIFLQDQMVTESMGPIFDRGSEHLGSSDAMIIQVRRRLIDAARALRDHGVTPDGVDAPQAFRVRSASVVLGKDEPWVEASREVVRAFSGLPVASA
jgi:nitrite reductase/ring-hydroxylating ferredoxin subunit